jgi:tetratricopeptide repeat protein
MLQNVSTNPAAPRRSPTMENGAQGRFVRDALPWILASVGFAVYLSTLNHWVSFANFVQVGRASGWVWQPDQSGPLTWLVRQPLRLFSLATRPLVLNLFAAFCAALTLAQLARSVALWPHDRTHDQRQRERGPFWFLSIRSAWMAPVLAVAVCGLQLTFWLHATSAASSPAPWGSGLEMLDLLMFAYIVRCLLELRISQNESWLVRAALVYGLALTNNWAMILYFPLFLASLIWIRGLAFFNTRFLVKMFLWGLAGLSLYLLLPIVQSTGDIAPVPFWSGLRQSLSSQKTIVTTMLGFFKSHPQGPQTALLLALTSLLPLLLISIRWASYFGDTSRLGVALTTFAFHIVHATFLFVCIWVALDPPFSPRYNLFGAGVNMPFATLSYLGALSVGYFVGYFLLIFGVPEPGKKIAPWLRYVGVTVVALVWILLLAAPILLIARNMSYVRATNGGNIRDYARRLIQGVPQRGGIVLSDDSRRLILAHSEAVKEGREKSLIFLDTASLKYPDYHRFLKKAYGVQWPVELPKDSVGFSDRDVIEILGRLAQTNGLYYLHPSFGYYFEIFYPEPHGLDFHLVQVSTNTLEVPLLPGSIREENKSFWSNTTRQAIVPLLSAVAPEEASGSRGGAFAGVFSRLHLKPEPNRELSVLAGFYSRALDSWGVELQRNGDFKQAREYFDLSQQLNSDNVVAKINLEYNLSREPGHKTSRSLSANLQDQFGKYRDWEQVMGENGPFDEPIFCFQEGMIYMRNSLYRQAAAQFSRTAALETNNLASRLWLAQLNVLARLPDRALDVLAQLRANPARFGISRTNENELLFVETSARLAKGDEPAARAGVQKALEVNPNDTSVMATAAQVYTKYGDYSNAVEMIDRQLRLAPNDVGLLLNKGFVCLQMNAYEQGIAPLTRVLTLETNTASETYNTALLDRAIAYLRSDKLDLAKKDYETLEKSYPSAYRIKYGLGEIAYRNHETNTAVRNYQLYLANGPTNTAEAKQVADRLKELKPGYP